MSAVEVDGNLDDLEGLRDEVAKTIGTRVREALGLASDPVLADAAETPDPNAVAIRAFSNVTGSEPDSALAQSLGRAVATHLNALDTLTVVSSENDATWVVTGGIQRVGETLRITARLVDRRGGAVVQAIKVDGSIDELARLQTEVAAAMSDGVRQALDGRADAL